MGLDLLAQTPDPGWVFDKGMAGTFVFCLVCLAAVAVFLLSWSDKQMTKRDVAHLLEFTKIADAVRETSAVNKEAITAIAGEVKSLGAGMKEGFAAVNATTEKRDAQNQALFDKQLNVVVEVTKSIGHLGAELSKNTKEIADVRHEVQEVRRDVQELKKPQP